MNEKITIRKKFLSDRLNLSKLEYQKKNKKILSNIKRSPFFNHDFICCFSAIKNEPDITPLISEFSNKKFFFPKVLHKNQMYFYLIHSITELKIGSFSILEPTSAVDKELQTLWNNESILFLVPGIAFDRTGGRLGYGKGFYDNFFHNLTIHRKNYTIVGVAFAQQIYKFKLPQNPDDVAMDFIVTENELIQGEKNDNI